MWKNERKEKTLNAKLFVRILPSTDFHYDSIKTETNRKVLYVRCLQDLSKGVKVKNPNYWYFCTDGVFWNSCQSEVYETVTSGLYEDLFDGVRAMILCYGQTGTGKSFTTSALRFPFQLFEEEEARRDVSRVKLGMSYLEFTGNVIKDLICNKTLDNLREVIEYPIPDEAWAWRQIFSAETRKSWAKSAPYKGANRGHSVLTFYIHSESLIDTDPVIRHSKIHIVDMGGIDNLGSKPSECRDKIDVGNSNLSKSLMEQFILCLNRTDYKNENYICPYKSSRLLLYLHDTLKQSSILRYIAHIHGNVENLSVTISTLKFGERIREQRPTKLEWIYQSNRELEVKNLEREYLRLKDEAELVGMLRDSPDYSHVSQERLQEIKRAAEAFFLNKLEDLTLFSLGQASLTLKVFRDLYQRLSAEKEQIMKDALATAAEMMQAQMAMDRGSSSTASVFPVTQKVSRRRSRQMESQASFGVSHRSTDSSHNFSKTLQPTVSQGGTTDRKGIGIGPGKTASSFEGNVTKALKKLRSKKSESVIMKGIKSATTKELGVLSAKNQVSDEVSEFSVGQGIPSRESAWQCFFNERTEEAGKLTENVETAEERAKEAKRNYLGTLGDLAKIREEIEETKVELEKCQHVRHIYGKGLVDDDGNPIPGEFERNLMGAIEQKEKFVNEAIENCHVALTDFRTAADELNEAKKTLEDVFQEFCKEHYKTMFPPDLPEDEMKPVDTTTGIMSEMDFKTKARMELYSELQQKLISYTSIPSKALLVKDESGYRLLLAAPAEGGLVLLWKR